LLKLLLPLPLFLSLSFVYIWHRVCIWTANGLCSTVVEDFAGEIEKRDKFEPPVTLSSHSR